MPGRPQFPQANCILIWGLGRYRPDGCSPRHPQDHASWPPLPAFPDVPEHPDERSPSCQARRRSLADTLLLVPLAVMSGTNLRTGVEQLGQVPVAGQSSEIAAIPKLPSISPRSRTMFRTGNRRRAALTRPGPSTAVQSEMVLWAAARQHRMQRVRAAPIPTQGHSRQPVGG